MAFNEIEELTAWKMELLENLDNLYEIYNVAMDFYERKGLDDKIASVQYRLSMVENRLSMAQYRFGMDEK